MKRCVGLIPWAALFLAIICGNILWQTAVKWMNIGLDAFFLLVCVPVAFTSSLPAGALVIAYYGIRRPFPIRCVTLSANIASILFGALLFYREYRMRPESHDPVFNGIFTFTLLSVIVALMESFVQRARFPYSEKSGKWLHCHAAEKQLVLEPGQQIPATFEEILAMNAATRTGREKFPAMKNPIPLLFLDPEPNGEHYLCCIPPPKKQSYFRPRLSPPKFVPVVLPVTPAQIEQLRARFGEFKKHPLTSHAAALIGDEIHKQTEFQKTPVGK